jgi:hypothetical protein
VHLAIDVDESPVGVDHRGAVVVDARRPLLEERDDDGDAPRLRDLRHGGRGGSRDRLREAEPVVVLLEAEVARVEQLLEADEPRALRRRLAQQVEGAPEVLRRVLAAAHLHESEPEGLPRGRRLRGGAALSGAHGGGV